MNDIFYKNYVQYGWSNRLYGRRQNDDETFWIKHGGCQYEPLDFRAECVRTAYLIAVSTNLPLVVHFSGGVDSEMVCRSFLEIGCKFKVKIWNWEDGLNFHDIIYAIDFCRRYNIEFSFLQLDFKSFITDGYKTWMDHKYATSVWYKILQKWAIQETEGYSIIGESTINPAFDPSGKKDPSNKGLFLPSIPWPNEAFKDLDADFYLLFPETYTDVYDFMEDRNKKGCLHFFSYTPEIIASYLLDPVAQDWMSFAPLIDLPDRLYPTSSPDGVMKNLTADCYKLTRSLGSGNSLGTVKLHIAYKHWPEMTIRPKYTGVEKVRDLVVDHVRKHAEERPAGCPGNQLAVIKLTDFMNYLLPQK